jgi:murein DD-endopeptidase MepM/ murein hydrolase activator NlpD
MRSDRLMDLSAGGTLRRFGVVVGVAVVLSLVGGVAFAEPIDLDEAEQQRDKADDRRQQLQEDLDVLLSRIEELKVAQEEQTARIKELTKQVQSERAKAQAAKARVADHYRKAYKSGTAGDPLVALFGGDSADDVAERSRVLGLLATDSEEEREIAESATLRGEALAEQLEQATTTLAEHEDELAQREEEAAEKVAEAEQAVAAIDEKIANEKERRAAAARRRAAQNDSGGSSGGSAGGGAPVTGGVACPVGTPRSYSDTYGAPRSGGRVHMGVDILAETGTPSYAYEDGTISRLSTNSLGGITLYLEGDSGNLYYYAHLSGYVSGISAGQSVTAGDHIAYVGMTGNAPIPHLHWEVMPGGGSNVNPTPYADRAC